MATTTTRKRTTRRPSNPATPAVPTFTYDESDGATITNPVALAEIVSNVGPLVKEAVKSYDQTDGIILRLTLLRMSAARAITLENGHPDWSARSFAYRDTIAHAEEAFWGIVGETDAVKLQRAKDRKRSVEDRMRQKKGRGGVLEAEITDHVVSALPADYDHKTLRWADRDDGLSILTGKIPEEVRAAVVAEYDSTRNTDGTGGIKAPDKFLPAEQRGRKGNTPGPGAAGPKAQRTNAAQYAASVEKGSLSAVAVLTDQLRVASALWSDRRSQEPKVKLGDPKEAAKLALRLSVILHAYGADLAGQIHEPEATAATSALFDAETDKA